jgi:hypothetical protein
MTAVGGQHEVVVAISSCGYYNNKIDTKVFLIDHYLLHNPANSHSVVGGGGALNPELAVKLNPPPKGGGV